MPTETTGQLSLHRKLAEIYAAVDRIPKNGTAPTQMGGFKFVMVGDVADAIRAELSTRHITMLPEEMNLISEHVEQTKAGGSMFFQSWRVTWRFTDGESGETCTIQSIGEGSDTHDKGAPKAQTAAMKYALLMAFLVPTGEDPEHADNPPTTRKPTPPPTPRGVAPAIQEKIDEMAGAGEVDPADDQWAGIVTTQTEAMRPHNESAPTHTDEVHMCPVHKWAMRPDKRASHAGEFSCSGKDKVTGEFCQHRWPE
jgi:hypothetical protein